ncbi:MAG: TonB-dependent receptor [Chitinophagaceae bacterium]|nr:TonB-dependent receptor [Chitinophagaceae bacterium]
MFKNILFLIGVVIFSASATAQSVLTIKTINAATGEPIEAITISVNSKAINKTDRAGIATLRLNAGKVLLHFSSVTYTDADTLINIPFPDTLKVMLTEKQTLLRDVTIVASTRNNQRIENSPLKVEVLGREEMEEESSIKPGGIASILGDVSGVQIQQSSATSGNANVRIQGLDGRYTQILRDGMPLYDGFSGGFGILSIPPLDLKQVELIKGSASTLYGGGAIGGLVNIISRKPTTQQQAVVSINQTTLKETNFNTYLSKRYARFGYTFFGGYNYQKAVDVNKDGFSDAPDLNGLVIHPKLFFYPDSKTSITAGYTGTFEKRNGGDMKVLSGNADAMHRYFEKNTISRHSVELTAQRNLSNGKSLDFKNSLSSFNRKISNNEIDFTGRQINYFTELSLLIPYHTNNFVAGINITGDAFKKITNDIPLNNFSNNTIGVFAQNSWNIKDNTTIEAGLRNDYQFTYGNFFLPRLAIFHRMNEHWAARAGVGLGYKIPNALAPQIVDYAIQNIQSLPLTIKAEKSIGYNAEVNYKTTWGDNNEIFINQAFFLTQLSNPIIATVAGNGNVTFNNMNKPVVSQGSDTYIRALIHNWEIYAGYTLTFAERKYLERNQFVPLTPKNRFAFTLVRDFEKTGFRFGIEGSYTGKQHREDYTLTPGYLFIAAMMEKKIGKHVSVVLNGENMLNYRQSKVEALYTGSIANPTFSPLWAPIDGRVINLSVKWSL